MPAPESLATNTTALERAVGIGDHYDYYVHVNEGTDDLLRYLTRVDGEDKYYAYVHGSEGSTLCIPPRYRNDAALAFPGDEIRFVDPGASVVDEVADVVGEDAKVAVPNTVPVGVFRELSSVLDADVVDEPDTVWCVKNEAEERILADIAVGVQHGIARAETVLAQSTADGDEVRWAGAELTTDRLRNEIKKALADRGLSDFGNVIIGAGPSCADLHYTGNEPIEPGDTVLIDLGPRGPFGYYGDITRTFVAGEPTEWVEETYAVVEEALDAAFDVLENGAGTRMGDLYGAMADVIESHGYGTGLHESRDDAVGLYHGTGHGIGVRIHEKPFQTADSEVTLQAGNVITIEPGVYDKETGGVRLEDVVVIREDGYENFMTYPRNLVPVERSSPPSFLE